MPEKCWLGCLTGQSDQLLSSGSGRPPWAYVEQMLPWTFNEGAAAASAMQCQQRWRQREVCFQHLVSFCDALDALAWLCWHVFYIHALDHLQQTVF
jgi:hypothetical protein